MANDQRKPDTAIDYGLHIDDIGLFGLVQKIERGKIENIVETWLAGGMAGELEIPLHALKAMTYKVTLGEVNPTVFAAFEAIAAEADVEFDLKIATKGKSFGKLVESFAGYVKTMDSGTLERGKLNEVSFEISISKLKIIKDSNTPYLEYDALNGIHKVNGNDMREKINEAIGL